MGALLALAATVLASSLDSELPPRITPIVELDTVERFHHAEVIQVRRDFGQPNVNVALDAWMPANDPRRIDAVRLWWSDEVDRYPFSERMLRHVTVDARRVRPDRWRITVGGDRQRMAFEVALHQGRPAAFADVQVAGDRVVRRCRAHTAELHARRVLGIPVGLGAMVVTCTAPDGTVHRGRVRVTRRGRR